MIASPLVPLRGLKQYNSNRIVEYRLAEDDGVELRFDFVEVENRKDCDRIRR